MPDNTYNEQLGLQMRTVRKGLRLSLHKVAEMSQGEFRSSVLGAYERGDRRITVERLHRLSEIYGEPIDRMLPAGTRSGAGNDFIDLRDPDLGIVDRLMEGDKDDQFRALRRLVIDLTDEGTKAVAFRQASTDRMASEEYRSTLQHIVALIDDIESVVGDLRHVRR